MKKNLSKLNKFLETTCPNDFYTISIYTFELRLQGNYKIKLIKQIENEFNVKFKKTYDMTTFWYKCSFVFEGVNIDLILTKKRKKLTS